MVRSIIVILTSLVMYGCITETVGYSNYTYKNELSVDIEIERWRHGRIKERFAIPQGSSYTTSYVEMGGGAAPFTSTDSLRVIFDSKKVLVYYPMDKIQLKNPFLFSSYKITSKAGDAVNFEYIFTQEQYDMAEPYDPDTENRLNN